VVTLPCLWFLFQAIMGSLALIDIGRIQSSPVLRLPMWIPYLSLPVGLGYFGLEFLLAMATRWRNPGAGQSTA
jgi:TRAP-type C4-dicarboxylate transport system permease small subunit